MLHSTPKLFFLLFDESDFQLFFIWFIIYIQSNKIDEITRSIQAIGNFFSLLAGLWLKGEFLWWIKIFYIPELDCYHLNQNNKVKFINNEIVLDFEMFGI